MHTVGSVDFVLAAVRAMARAHTRTPLPALVRAYLVYCLPSMLACYSYTVCLSPVCALREVVDAVKSSMERSISTNQHCCILALFFGPTRLRDQKHAQHSDYATSLR
jgi:hypothetical protein